MRNVNHASLPLVVPTVNAPIIMVKPSAPACLNLSELHQIVDRNA